MSTSTREIEIIRALEQALQSAHHYLRTSGFGMKEIDAALEAARKHEPLAATRPRVLVVVSGGIADPIYDSGVDVEVFDWDDFNEDPKNTALPPVHFSDLAEQCNVPIAENASASRCRMGRV